MISPLGQVGPWSSATLAYRASSHMAVALIVIEVLARAIGMPSKRVRTSPEVAHRYAGWNGF